MSGSRRLGAAEVRRLLDEHGVSPTKALGQNFVIDPNVVERIARLAAVGPGERVVEIGPGLGSLTVALLATGASVTAVEIDRGLAAALATVVGDEARIIVADALRLDWATLLEGERHTVVANLPYNVATPLVVGILRKVPEITRLVVMVQREVAERFAAVPASKAYGAVSVRIAYFATARLIGSVPPSVFHPRPTVSSSLVEIERRPAPAVDVAVASFDEINALVVAGFAQRRKMLRRSLSGLVVEETFSCAGLAGTERAEELDVVAWGKLAACRRSTTNAPSPS